MWMFTPIGFFSVVQHRDDPATMLIRARAEEDLVNLFDFANQTWADQVGGSAIPDASFRHAEKHLAEEPTAERTTRYPIVKNPAADYAFRAFVPRTWWNTVASALANAVDYPNFKDRVKEVQGHDRAAIYLRVWSAMMALQDGEDLPGPHGGQVTAGQPKAWDWYDDDLFDDYNDFEDLGLENEHGDEHGDEQELGQEEDEPLPAANEK